MFILHKTDLKLGVFNGSRISPSSYFVHLCICVEVRERKLIPVSSSVQLEILMNQDLWPDREI